MFLINSATLIGTLLLRDGVSLPALMRLLGHHTAHVSLCHLEVTQLDIHREYHAALKHPPNVIRRALPR